MNKRIIYAMLAMLTLLTPQAVAQQTDPAQTPAEKPKPRPAPPKPKPLMEAVRDYVQKMGATVDESKSSAVMVVSNYVDEKAGTRTNVVILQGKNKSLLSFYVYNFGNVKNAPNKEEVYHYLLTANEKISLGTFFVDDEDDIGYKYLVSAAPTMTRQAFDSIYMTMLAVEREHKPQIRKLLGLEPEKPLDPKKAAEDKPPISSSNIENSQQSGIQDSTQQNSVKDFGIDTAFVTLTMANLRQEPDERSGVILALQKGSFLALIERSPTGSWYNVIDVHSGREGWIHGNTIKINYTKNRNPSSFFQAERTGADGPPLVEVGNDSNKNLNLRLGQEIHQVPSNSRKSLSVVSGQYKYYASAPGVIPTFGEQTFNSGHKYTWKFWIETTHR